MSFFDLIQALIRDTLASVDGFAGELALCATIVLILLLKIPRATSRIDSFYVMLVGSAVALYLAGPWHAVEKPAEIFTGLLAYDAFTVYFRTLLLFFAVLFAIFTRISGVPDRDAAPDIYALVLGATLGMCIMASAHHLLMVFLGVEMASVPSYVLAGLMKGRRQSSEAAIKYAVYGAGAAGVMLYGISLLAGVLGSVHIPTMAVRLANLIQPANLEHHIGTDTHMVLVLGGLMMLVGVAFKLSAVPFHFWCPDVFEGASAEVDAFLSVASKAAALALLARLAIGFGYIPEWSAPPEPVAVHAASENVAAAPPAANAVRPVSLVTTTTTTSAAAATPALTRDQQNAALTPARDILWRCLAFLAVITCTFGNLAAYGQTNIKRLLAYSTIAQAGYMIMPVPAAMLLANSDAEAASEALSSMAFYTAVYLFMNLGAFACVAFLRNVIRSEEINDYAGLIRRYPVVVVCFSILLFSLIGLPPFAGFAGKLLIFRYLVQAKMWGVLVIAGLNTAISLYYYLRVVKIMTIDPEPEQRTQRHFPLAAAAYVLAMTVPVFVLGISFDRLNALALTAARHLF